MTEEANLNYENMKISHNFQKMAIKQMVRAFVKAAPKEVLIEVLKAEKIIERDWEKNRRKT